jgi:hypothetical protein
MSILGIVLTELFSGNSVRHVSDSFSRSDAQQSDSIGSAFTLLFSCAKYVISIEFFPDNLR